MSLPVNTKKDFVRRYQEGEFGNMGPTWSSLKDFMEEFQTNWPPEETLFHLRNRVKGGPTFYNMSFSQVREFVQESKDVSNIYVTEMAPTSKTLLQGEVMLNPGLVLTYSKVVKPMREALEKETRVATNLSAKLLLASCMNAVSLDWLNVLLEIYPGHIVEFSSYSVNWGTLPGYNTVFWEVRNY